LYGVLNEGGNGFYDSNVITGFVQDIGAGGFHKNTDKIESPFYLDQFFNVHRREILKTIYISKSIISQALASFISDTYLND
jgi:hypothetical protein